MPKILLTIVFILLNITAIQAQEYQYLQDLKRPRYSVIPNLDSRNHTQQQAPAIAQEQQPEVSNKKFCGKFKGTVTVHYEDRLVKTEANLTITTDASEANSHYDYYILPANGDYLENNWKMENSEVKRSITISGHTIYVTDIIAYESKGGNSQIRTLVFSNDYSAFTFLKTEFDDAVRDTATGQIIGRFEKVE